MTSKLQPFQSPIALALLCVFCLSVSTIGQSEDQTSFFPLELIWSSDIGPSATWPAYDDTHIYVPLRGGQLIAVSLLTGLIDWTIDQQINLIPTTGEGLVYVTSGKNLRALEATSGTTRWEISFDSAISAPLFWDAGWLIVALENGDLFALRGSDGNELWKKSLNETVKISPTIGGQQLFIPTEAGRILSLDLRSGKKIWEQMLNEPATPILALDDLFLGSTDNFFYRLSKNDGSIKWRWRTGADIIGLPSVDKDRVYFISLDNVVRALDRNSGNQRWTRTLDTRAAAGPHRVGNQLLVSGLSQEVNSFRLVDGESTGTYLAPTDLGAPPHVVKSLNPRGPHLIILTGPGTLIGLRQGQNPPLVPLHYLPGRLTLSDPPLVPLTSLPGTSLPLLPAL